MSGVVITSAIAALALLVSFATFLHMRRQTRAAERSSQTAVRSEAREEAMELAEVRGRVIDDLEQRVDELARQQKDERKEHEEQLTLLRGVIEHVRSEAAENTRLLVVGFRGVVLKVLGHLEAKPAEVDKAVAYLREMLRDEPPTGRRRAA